MPLTTVSQGLLSTDAQYTGFKNRLINGGMTIDQRNVGTSVTANAGTAPYCPDRWNGRVQQASGAFTMQQSTVAPAGFVNSLLLTVTNTTAPAAGNRVHVRQIIEGFNVADLGWGTANAQPVTLSFWVRSSLTGLYGVGFINQPENRSYVGTYTISAANTWEFKTITVPGDTTGTWQTNNTDGIRLTFDLGSGTSYNASSAGTWVAQEACRTSSCVNWQQSSGATFYITGCQLEKGQTATSFDIRSIGTELALCQRYYSKSYLQTVVPGSASATGAPGRFVDAVSNYASIQIFFPQSMRATPTVTPYNPSTGTINQMRTDAKNIAASVSDPGPVGCFIHANNVAVDYTSDSTRVHYTASAEL